MERGRWQTNVRAAPSGASLGALGRADRFPDARGELWRLPAEDERAAKRLLALGEKGVGGFIEGGADVDGVWLVRGVAARHLDAVPRGEKWGWREAVGLVGAIAAALEACEKAGLFPGPLKLGEIAIEPAAWITAESLVRALVGGADDAHHGSSAPSPKWTPLEQAEGAPWDNAANRYVLGLIAYRLLAGTQPFGGAGLRHALTEQQTAVPPFEDDVARELRPGVQSFVLSMIDPKRSRRPADAAAIAKRCDELLRGDASSPRPEAKARPALATALPRARRASSASPRRVPWTRLALAALPILASIAVAAVLFAASPAPIAAPARPAIAPAHLAGTTPADCQGCHARQVAEWQRSVMAHATKSPLFGALESVVEEQVGRASSCPHGAGALRKAGSDICRDDKTGLAVTGTGGEHWCVNCHAPGDNLRSAMPAWTALGSGQSRLPLRDLLPTATMDGISCAVCHQTTGPVAIHREGRAGAYEGNPTWTSPVTGAIFAARPEDSDGHAGIANSGYLLDPRSFVGAPERPDGMLHRRPSSTTKGYLQSSEFCGGCHDVRLFGSDAIGAPQRGEHFKRLRNAYSEWRTWADSEARSGRTAATCRDCHMSLYPGVCVPGAGSGDAGGDCPSGTRFEARGPGAFARATIAAASPDPARVAQHYFTSVDIPLTPAFPDAYADDRAIDAFGLPIGLRARRDQLLRHTFRFAVGDARRSGATLEIPIQFENTGAGHRVPAGFSQEREIWVELTVTDARGAVVYEVGKIDRPDADLRDKIFLRVTTTDRNTDDRGRPLGVFGADIVDGPDVPEWSPNPRFGGTSFRGKGLINFQNGFLRCVKCIGFVDGDGHCQATSGQGRTRADRFDDGAYDIDTGECRSNLRDGNEFFETYFPVGALDADRGLAKAPDAIIDTRSVPPGVPIAYTYVLDAGAHPPPFRAVAKLRFRSFPPFLVRAFAEYEAEKARSGERPSGAQVTTAMLRRIDPVDVASVEARIE